MTFGRSRRPDDWPTIHDRARAALSAQLDGELDPAETDWLDGHLAGCPNCRQAADDYAAQRFELRALRDHQPLPPRDLWARTAAAIELEASGHSRGRAPARRLLLAPSAFIATALVVAVAAGLLRSSQLPGDGNGGSSSFEVANASAPSPVTVAGGPTPIPVRPKNVEVVAPDASGKLTVKVTKVVEVCPKDAAEPCDTSSPVEERPVQIDQGAQAVFGDTNQSRLIVVSSPSTDDRGTVQVVALTDDTSAGPSAPPASPSSSPVAASHSPAASASPSPTPTASATASSVVLPSASPTVTATPTGSIDVTPSGQPGATVEIATGVALVGQTASYSASQTWFAFTARPIDGSAGPDIYVWQVGTPSARRITDDGRSVFGSWAGDLIVGSTALDEHPGPSGPATTGLRPLTFVLDPATGVRTDLASAGRMWRPAIDPNGGRRAVYWAGTVRQVEGPSFEPEAGRLVLGDWSADFGVPAGSPQPSASTSASASAGASPSASPDASAADGDQERTRHEITIGAGQLDDFDARWDPSGTHLAVWIADSQDPTIGRLSLYTVQSFDGSIDLKAPLLDARIASAGFSIADGQLIWSEPPSDPAASSGSVQLLAWSSDGVGTVETFDGSALVIR